jgi:hypothetical protein
LKSNFPVLLLLLLLLLGLFDEQLLLELTIVV